MVYWRNFGAWKKKNKSAEMDLMPSVCVSFKLIGHNQQPMKMDTAVMLLYKYQIDYITFFCACVL